MHIPSDTPKIRLCDISNCKKGGIMKVKWGEIELYGKRVCMEHLVAIKREMLIEQMTWRRPFIK